MIEILILTLIISPLLILALRRVQDIFLVSGMIQIISIILTSTFIYFYLNKYNYSFLSQVNISGLGALMILTIMFVSNAAIFYSYTFLGRELKNKDIDIYKIRLFYVLVYMFIASLLLIVSTDNVGISWLGVELSTLTSTFLVGFYTKKTSIEAAWKYFIINSIGVTIALLGILFFIFAGSKYLTTDQVLNFTSLTQAASHFDPTLIKIGFVFIIIGFGTKVGLFPMHTWLPDAHSKAVTPVSGILSSVLLPTALLVILKFKTVVDITLGSSAFSSSILIVFGVLSIIYSALLIFVQKNYKRLLAYSSIEHMGILVILFALNTPIALLFACYHYVFHALIKSSLFFLSGNIYLNYKTTKISHVSGVIKHLPVTGFLFLIFILAIIGFPPFGIFTTEFGMFREVTDKVVNPSTLNLFSLNNNALIFSILLGILLLSLGIIAIGFITITTRLILKDDNKTSREIHYKDNHLGNIIVGITLVILILISFDLLPFVRDIIKNFIVLS